METSNILLEIKGLEKKYSGTTAIKDIDMVIEAGKIVGVVGENGAGKSTLLKLIMGVEQPTAGTMMARGERYAPRNAREASVLGVGMVFQEQSLVLNLTVGQNMYLGREKQFVRNGFVRWSKMYEKAQAYLEYLDIKGISARKKVIDYMFSDRQMIEVARVLNMVQESGHEKTLILLDEPTSVLNESETQQLFGYMRKLKNEGHSVIFVSHRLDEVLEISDLVYVFKDGREVGCLDIQEANQAKLYRMMVGSTTSGEYYRVNEQLPLSDQVVLEFDKVGLKGSCKDISFKLHKGEVLGICGVSGSGKESVCAILCGDITQTSGNYKMGNHHIKFRQPSDALDSGILSIPKERREEAICEGLSIAENIILSNFQGMEKYKIISPKIQKQKTREYIEKLNIKCFSGHSLLEELSGGNAQKVVFARVLHSGAKVLVLNHPTRGVDVGAKMDIYGIIRELAKQGTSVILLGDTLEECIGLSNRVLVMKDGKITREYDAPPNAKPTQIDIIHYMM